MIRESVVELSIAQWTQWWGKKTHCVGVKRRTKLEGDNKNKLGQV